MEESPVNCAEDVDTGALVMACAEADDAANLPDFEWNAVPDNAKDAYRQLWYLFDSKDWLADSGRSIERALELMTAYPILTKPRYYFRPVKGRGIQLEKILEQSYFEARLLELPAICHFLKHRGYTLNTIAKVHELDHKMIRATIPTGYGYGETISMLHLACSYTDGQQREVIEFILENHNQAKFERLGGYWCDAAPFDTFMYHTVAPRESTMSLLKAKELKETYEKLWVGKCCNPYKSMQLAIRLNCQTAIQFLVQEMSDSWEKVSHFDVTNFDKRTALGWKSVLPHITCPSICFFFNLFQCDRYQDTECCSHRALFELLSDQSISFPKETQLRFDAAVQNEHGLARALEDGIPMLATSCSIHIHGYVTPRVLQSLQKACSASDHVQEVDCLIRREYNVDLKGCFLLSFLQNAPRKTTFAFCKFVDSSTENTNKEGLSFGSTNGNLEQLRFHGCHFAGNSFCRIVRGLSETTPTLRNLALWDVYVGCDTEATTDAIITLLKKDHLREICLDNLDVDVVRLCGQIECNENLFKVTLIRSEGNSFEEGEIKAMADALKKNHNLVHFCAKIEGESPAAASFRYYQLRNQNRHQIHCGVTRKDIVELVLQTYGRQQSRCVGGLFTTYRREESRCIGGPKKELSLIYELLREVPHLWGKPANCVNLTGKKRKRCLLENIRLSVVIGVRNLATTIQQYSSRNRSISVP